METAKDTILNNMSKFQIACKPGHCPSKHLFTLKSVMAYFESKRKSFLVAGYDLKKFFDFEELEDCMDSLYKRNIRGKLYRLISDMNKNVRIRVKTAVGTSESKETGPIVTQGGVDAAIISANNVDVGLTETFGDETNNIKYEDLSINALGYMDDILDANTDVASVQKANNLMEELVGRKNLQFNLDKSVFLLVGNSRTKKRLKKELGKNPLTLCGVKMKEVQELKYLGNFISSNLLESVHRTIIKRIGIAKHTVIEIRNIIEDARATKLRGMNVAFYIFRAAVLSMLLHNAETFYDVSKKR